MATRERADGGRSLMRPDSWLLALISAPRAEGGKVLAGGGSPPLVAATPAFTAAAPRADGGRLPPRGAARGACVASAKDESATESCVFLAWLMPVASCSAAAYPTPSALASGACAARESAEDPGRSRRATTHDHSALQGPAHGSVWRTCGSYTDPSRAPPAPPPLAFDSALRPYHMPARSSTACASLAGSSLTGA